MPRQSAISVQNNFSKGLITTASPLKFPENACTDLDNCIFTIKSAIERRTGIDYEYNSTSSVVGSAGTYGACSEFVWTGVGGLGSVSLLVRQIGRYLYFHDLSDKVTVDDAFAIVDLALYVAYPGLPSPQNYACQFAQGNGCLFVANPSIDPLQIQYASSSLGVKNVYITIRDLWGFQNDSNNLSTNIDSTRITSTVAALATTYPYRYYNLMNQGWGETNALTLWDTARVDTPNNYDYIALYRSSPSVSFDNTLVSPRGNLNVLAPRGHFILNAFNQDRSAALVAEGFAPLWTGGGIANVQLWMPSNYYSGFSYGGTPLTWNSTGTAYFGGNLGSAVPITSAKVTFNTYGSFRYFPIGYLTVDLRASNTIPTSATDGVSLGSHIVTSTEHDAGFAYTIDITSSNPVTPYQYVFIVFNSGTIPIHAGNLGVSIGTGATVSSPSLNYVRPSCVAFYAGRAFWGGADAFGTSGNIYYSQIPNAYDYTSYGKCYMKNDPTSEIAPDLLPDDGGIIVIPEMGKLQRLYQFQSVLIAFASNGVWSISGSGNAPFKADDYVVKKISSVGMFAPQSVVDFKSTPLFWAEDGIYAINYDPKYESLSVESLTTDTIFDFYQKIPMYFRSQVKGIYDPFLQTCQWLYNDGSIPGDVWAYNRVLNLNGHYSAFYPWTFNSNPNGYVIKGFSYCVDALHQLNPRVKYLLVDTVNNKINTAHMTYANYADWKSADMSLGIGSYYDSYFTTAYRLDGQTQKKFQPGYAFVFFNNYVGSSAYVQAIYNFAIDPNGGKFSGFQQAYDDKDDTQSVSFCRFKIRGVGQALQLHVKSESDKIFSILGWSLDESTNSNV